MTTHTHTHSHTHYTLSFPKYSFVLVHKKQPIKEHLLNKKISYIQLMSTFFWKRVVTAIAIGGSTFTIAQTASTLASPMDDKDRSKTKVYSWGLGLSGQLGHGDTRNEPAPKQIQALSRESIKYIALGGQCSAAITEDGRLFSWGSGQDGRLGLGSMRDANQSFPCAVDKLRFKDVSLGEFHMAGITSDGQVVAWGRGFQGQLGTGSRVKSQSSPQVVVGLDANDKPVQVSCGYQHTAIVTESGKLWTFGSGIGGQLGHGDKTDQYAPVVVSSLKDEKVVQVACGRDFTLALTDKGAVYTCGAEDFGQAGHGKLQRYVLHPSKIAHLSDIVAVAAGDYHATALSKDGFVYSWGLGLEGQLGNGTKTDQAHPELLTALKDKKIIQIACGSNHSAAITRNGELYMWGRGREGQVGRGNHVESPAAYHVFPILVDSLPDAKLVALGRDHSMALA